MVLFMEDTYTEVMVRIPMNDGVVALTVSLSVTTVVILSDFSESPQSTSC
jgi:hypothetical protein